MSRLIVNERSETVRAMARDNGIMIQAGALADRVVTINTLTTVEVALGRREAVAFALQILDELGVAANVKDYRK